MQWGFQYELMLQFLVLIQNVLWDRVDAASGKVVTDMLTISKQLIVIESEAENAIWEKAVTFLFLLQSIFPSSFVGSER